MRDFERSPEQTYIENMLLNVADELNVKEVVIESEEAKVYATYYYDTLSGTSIGFKGDEWQMATLIFTGDVVKDMEFVRDTVNVGLRQRADSKIKVRQPLQRITLFVPKENI